MGKKINRLQNFLYPIFELKFLFFSAIFIAAFTSASEVVGVYLLKIITNYIESGEVELLLVFTYVFLGVIIAKHLVGRVTKCIQVDLKCSSKEKIYEKYVNKFIQLDNNKSENMGTGRFIAILQNGIMDRSDLLDYISREGMQKIFAVLFSIILVYILIPEYFRVFLLIFIFFVISTIYTNYGALRRRKQKIEARNAQTKQLIKIIMSKFEILQNYKAAKEIEILKKYNNDERNFNYKTYFWLRIMFLTPIVSIDLLKVAVVLVIGVGVINGYFSLGDFVALSLLLVYLLDAVRNVVDFYKTSTQMYTNVEKMYDIFDEIPQIQGYEKGEKFNFKKGDIVIKNMDFAYGDKMIFNDFSMKIKGGSKTAVVGISGSGKTTLVKLISGYLYPNSGKIVVDGQNLQDVSLKSFYKNIGYLTQDPGVLDTSVYENLVYGLDKEIKDEEIKKAIKLAECEFIYEFQDGLDTEIGERGIRLSGGQRQRLAIAKLFLKNPKILILDEPTSALDSFSEEKIGKALNKLFEGRTVIIIAHRLQTVIESDEIVVIESGKIIERGTHNDLVKLGGEYSKMLDLQSGVFVNGGK